FGVRLGLPDLQEQERGDQRSERGEDVGQRIVEQVRGDELTDRKAAARDEKHRPDRPDRAHPVIDRHDVKRQEQRDHRKLAADHRAERGRRQPGHRSEYSHRHAQRPERHRAVLKMSTKTSASSASNPTRIRSDEVIATGVPKPATPSSSAPKQKPITTTRRSFGRWSMTQTLKASNRPDFTAIL